SAPWVMRTASVTLIALGIAHSTSAQALDFRRAPSENALLMLRHLQTGTAAAPATTGRAARTAPRAAFGRNVLVNDPDLDHADMTSQSETTLAVRGSTVCAGYNNTRHGPIPNSLAGLSRSSDGGVTWTDLDVTGPVRFSDPVVVVHNATGHFYYASLA